MRDTEGGEKRREREKECRRGQGELMQERFFSGGKESGKT